MKNKDHRVQKVKTNGIEDDQDPASRPHSPCSKHRLPPGMMALTTSNRFR